MSKHTPGKWAFAEVGTKHIFIYAPGQEVVCRIKNDVSGKPISLDDIANARLISAAPELLEALRESLQSLEYVHRAHPEVAGIAKRIEDIERARAAIAKATDA